MYKCPHPDCTYVAAHAILNSHAKTHGFSKVAEMTKVHGPVKRLNLDPKSIQYARQSTVNIKEGSFNNIENAMSRMNKVDRTDLRNRS